MIVITKKVFHTLRSIHKIYNIAKEKENVPNGENFAISSCIKNVKN